MSLPIISADQRLAEPRGIKGCIFGKSGIGKTSLFRVLRGLDAPRAGSVRFGDRDLTTRAVGPSERPFAWVPQEAPVIAATLRDNVMLGAKNDARASSLLAELGADELADAVGDATLGTERAVSGGERQWIAMARALATQLPVLLLDEPTSALDPDAQSIVLRAIERLRGKRTVIVVTHRPEPLAIADVVVRLEKLDAVDEPAALREEPRRRVDAGVA